MSTRSEASKQLNERANERKLTAMAATKATKTAANRATYCQSVDTYERCVALCVAVLALYVCIKCERGCVRACVGVSSMESTVVRLLLLLLSFAVILYRFMHVFVYKWKCVNVCVNGNVHFFIPPFASFVPTLRTCFNMHVCVCVHAHIQLYILNNTKEVCTYKNTNVNAYIQ